MSRRSALSSSQRIKRHLGLTLVELLIALVLGLIVVLVVGQIYLSGRQSYRTQTGFGGMQENGRFALFFLQRDIQRAGFPRVLGPGGSSPVVASFNVANTIEGGGNNSDQIEIQYNSFGGTVTTDGIPGALVPLVTANNTDATSDDDCLGQDSTAALNPDGSRLVSSRYSVNAGNLQCLGGGNASPQPIIPGVESMQILYGEDTDGDTFANVYRRANQVAIWDNVVAVRVGLLLNSGEPVLAEPDTTEYAVLDAPPTAPLDDPGTAIDERLFSRRVFTTTIQLRNRSTI